MNILNKLTHPIFNNCTLEELNYLLKVSQFVVFNADDVLICEGDKSRTIYVILEGKVKVTKEGESSKKKVFLATLGKGSVLGEISIITNRPRTATVTAVDVTSTLVIDVGALENDNAAKSLLEKLRNNLTLELSKKLVYSNDKVLKFDADERIDAQLAVDKLTYVPNAIVLFFGWKWVDIMHEIPFLAQHGYDAIKIYPPQEFVVRAGNPWWQIYQPVSYFLSQYYGSEQDFIEMIDLCHSYNIKVYVDLVINHMAEPAESEAIHVGTNGHAFSSYHYGPLNKDQDVFEYDDFYHFKEGGNLQISNDDYCKLETIWHLEHYDLVQLPKLNLDSKHVKTILKKYIDYLLSLGVDGFRVDAAKHLNPKVVTQLLADLRTQEGLKPFIYQEYYADAPMGIDPYSYLDKYFKIGYVTSFSYGNFIADAITNRTNNLQKLIDFSFGSSWIHQPENRTVTVIDNHDTERMMPSMLNYKCQTNNAYVLAYIFMLAWPFGVPKVMSGFRFATHNDPMPTTPVWQNGRNTCFDKDSPWVAQHRWDAIANMVLFRYKTRDAKGIAHVWTNGNQVAFARVCQKPREYVATAGFVVINNTATVLKHKFDTGLPAGKYFNLITSSFVEGKMQGPTIEIEDYGLAVIEVQPFDAVALVIDYVE